MWVEHYLFSFHSNQHFSIFILPRPTKVHRQSFWIVRCRLSPQDKSRTKKIRDREIRCKSLLSVPEKKNVSWAFFPLTYIQSKICLSYFLLSYSNIQNCNYNCNDGNIVIKAVSGLMVLLLLFKNRTKWSCAINDHCSQNNIN